MLCDNIYRSLPYKTDSVTIIFQHILRQSSLYFLNKKPKRHQIHLEIEKMVFVAKKINESG